VSNININKKLIKMENKKRLVIENFNPGNKLQLVRELALNMKRNSNTNENRSFLKEAKDIVGKANVKVLCTEIELTWDDRETEVNSELTESEKKMVETSKKSTIEGLESLVDLKVTMNKEAERTYKEKELNLCELLRNCIGMTFYMPHYGEVRLISIDGDGGLDFYNGLTTIGITEGGLSGSYSCGEVCVFPSKKQRDWSLFQPPWIPQEGERVWARNHGGLWIGTYFAEMGESFGKKKFRCTMQKLKKGETAMYQECVPFNEIPW
jgi:hypothetical protein